MLYSVDNAISMNLAGYPCPHLLEININFGNNPKKQILLADNFKKECCNTSGFVINCRNGNRVAGWTGLPFFQNGGDAYEKSF